MISPIIVRLYRIKSICYVHFALTFIRPCYISSLMAHLHKKMKNGKPYYYVREIARVDGKPKVVKQVYLGPPERLIALIKGDRDKCSRISVQEFGALWLANQIEERVDLISIIDSVVPRTARETGPSVGEYFIYSRFQSHERCLLQGEVCPIGTRDRHTVHRPVDMTHSFRAVLEKIGSGNQRSIEEMQAKFSKKFPHREPQVRLLPVTTRPTTTPNAGQTPSELAKRGKNKEARMVATDRCGLTSCP